MIGDTIAVEILESRGTTQFRKQVEAVCKTVSALYAIGKGKWMVTVPLVVDDAGSRIRDETPTARCIAPIQACQYIPKQIRMAELI